MSATTTPILLRPVAQGMLRPDRSMSHHFALDAILDAYDTFARAANLKALKGSCHPVIPWAVEPRC